MRDKLQNDSGVLECKIVVTKNGDKYDATYDPEIIKVEGQNNVTVNFHLDMPTPDDVVIDNVVIEPLGQTQLTDLKISSNRKHFSVLDQNTVKQKFHLSISYKDKHGSAALASPAPMSLDVPQIDNNPPGLEMPTLMTEPDPENNPPG